MLDMTLAKDKTWSVYTNYVNGKPLYSIGRKRFENQPLHSGNIEKAFDGKYFDDKQEALTRCNELNQKENADDKGKT